MTNPWTTPTVRCNLSPREKLHPLGMYTIPEGCVIYGGRDGLLVRLPDFTLDDATWMARGEALAGRSLTMECDFVDEIDEHTREMLARGFRLEDGLWIYDEVDEMSQEDWDRLMLMAKDKRP